MKGCFLSSTKIKTPFGDRKIKDIKVNDEVYAFDKTGKISKGIVTQTFKHSIKETNDEIIKITHEKGILYPTVNHYLFTDDLSNFKEAKDFQVGNNLVLPEGILSKITSIESYSEVEYTYNLSVKPHHTFIADGVLVHNKGGGKSGQERTPKEAPNSLQSVAFVRIVDLISEGEIEGYADEVYLGANIFFDETPLYSTYGAAWNFVDTYVESRPGTAGQPYLASRFIGAGTPVDVGAEVTKIGGPIVRTISDDDVDAVKVLITVPSLFIQDDNGDINEASVTLNLYIQPDGGGYSAAMPITISGKCTSDYQRQILVDNLKGYGNAPYNIKITRVTDDSGSIKTQNATYWTTYTELIYDKLYYPYSALIGVEARYDQFNRVPERKYHIKGIKVRVPSNYNPVTREYTGIWNGVFSSTRQYTNNPAWILFDILTSKRYGYGLEDSQIDTASFYTVSQYNDVLVDDGYGGTIPRYTFNSQIQAYTESFYLANILAGSMRSMLYWTTSKVFISQDRPSSVILNVSNSNVEGGEFNYQSTSKKDRHTQVAVQWNDPDDYYNQAIEFIDDRESINIYGVRRLDTIAYGCTNRSQALRFGRWILDTEKYSTETVTYVGGLDHAGVVPGDIISIYDDHYVGSRNSGRVVDSTSTTSVRLDAPVTLVSGKTYQLRVTLPDGTLQTKNVSTGVGTHTTLTTAAYSIKPNKESVWQLLVTDKSIAPRQFRIISKTERDKVKYEISALFHDPDKYVRVEQGIYFDPPIYTNLPSANKLEPPSNLTAEEYQSTEGTSRMFNVLLSWTHSPDTRKLTYEIQYRKSGFAYRTDGDTADRSYVLNNVTAATYDFRIRTVGMTGQSNWLTLEGFQVYADTTAAADITGLQIVGGGTTFSGKNCEFEWDEITLADEADFKDYKIEILNASNDAHIRYIYTIVPTATYTYDMNLEDSSGVPKRSIKVKVWCRDIYDSVSVTPATATFSNPAPDMSSTLPVVTQRPGYLEISWAVNTDVDMEKYYVYGGITNPPTIQIATIIHPDHMFEYFNVEFGTTYYVKIVPYDLFGIGIASQIPAGNTPLQIDLINVDIELQNTVTITSDSSYTGTISTLYDKILDSGGITIANPSGKYIQHLFTIENYFHMTKIWSVDTNPNVYIAYSVDNITWNYLKCASGHVPDAYSKLAVASSQSDAQTNYWDLAAGYNKALWPSNVTAKYIRVYFVNSNATQIYELQHDREVIAEDVVTDRLSAISANVGTVTAGVIQSSDYTSTDGIKIDLTNDLITMKKANDTKVSINGATGDVTLKGTLTISAGSTGYTNINDKPTNLSGINSTEGSKLTGIAVGADVTNYADTRVANSILDANALRINAPIGGTYAANGTATGAIVITLPQSWTNTMLFFEVTVYNYVASKSFTIYVGGYNYLPSTTWSNCSANLIGDISANNRVRFGHDGSKCCIVIGETTSTWEYPRVTIKNFQAGYSNFTVDQWDDGWVISTNAVLSGYTFTADFSDSLIDAATIKSQGTLATLSSIGTNNCDTTLITGGKITTDLVNANSILAGSVTAVKIGASQVTATHVGANQIITQEANIGTAKINTLHLVGNSISNFVVYSNSSNTSIDSWTYHTWYDVFWFDYTTSTIQPEYALMFGGQIGAELTMNANLNYYNYNLGLILDWIVYNVSTGTNIYEFTDYLGFIRKILMGSSSVYGDVQPSGMNFLYSINSGWSPGQTIRLYCKASRQYGSGVPSNSTTGWISLKSGYIMGLKR
jgi:predicted phage tail protein